MTADLLEDLGSIFDARVPRRWTHDASGAEISWLMPNLGGWFTGLLDRQTMFVEAPECRTEGHRTEDHSNNGYGKNVGLRCGALAPTQMLSTWLENGRSVMKSYWLTGFTNAQGFLTGMRQEVTRQHKKDQWALDDVISHTEILAFDHERIREVPDEGQHIHGLFMEGARWNRADSRLDESEPKKLFVQMPAIFVTATTAKDLRAMGINYGHHGPYNCAVYKYPKRNDRYLIFRLLLKTEQHPNHWKLRGVALNAQTE